MFAPGNLGKGDLNIYRMFTETALSLTRCGAYAAQFVPEGIPEGANAAAIRGEIFDYFNLILLVSFVNSRAVWFPSVHQQFEFCLYVAKKGGATESFQAAFRVASHQRLTEIRKGAALSIPVSLIGNSHPMRSL